MPIVRLPPFERRLRHPACALVGAAAVAALAFILVSPRALPLLGGILATLALGCVGPWIAIRSVSAALAWDRRRARVGEPLTATIAWRSILPWWRPQVSLRWPDAEPTTQGLVGSVAVVPQRRGRYPRVAPAIESSQPFGIFTARRTLAMPEAVIVWPARADVRMPFGLAATAGAGREMSERITGHSGDPIGVRDYRAGDSVRSIHWAHTARRDVLVVRERPGTAGAVVRLVVDHRIQRSASDGSAGANADPDHTLDALIGIAFAIVESWRPRGVAFELVWPGREPLDPRTPAEFAAMFDELACLEPCPAANIEPGLACGRTRPVDIEIMLTTPLSRPAVDRSAAAPRHKRLWIIVGGSTAVAARPGRGRGEMIVHVPLVPDPIAAVDAAFAGLSHDPDTSPRTHVAGRRRSYAPT